jgi:hypothetical protein
VTAPTAAMIRKLGPGTLTVGAVGSPVDFSNRCTSVTVTWKEDKVDDVDTLSGDTIAGERNYSATLEAKVYQDDLQVGALDVGGDVSKKNTSDIKWACVGEPQLVDDLS